MKLLLDEKNKLKKKQIKMSNAALATNLSKLSCSTILFKKTKIKLNINMNKK